MGRADKIALTVIVVYFLGAFATYGHVYNAFVPAHQYDFTRDTGAVFAGMTWPIYWAGRIAIEVMP